MTKNQIQNVHMFGPIFEIKFQLVFVYMVKVGSKTSLLPYWYQCDFT